VTNSGKHMKYLSVGVSSVKSPFNWSLFTDSEPGTSESDLSLITQRGKKDREKHFTKWGTSVSFKEVYYCGH